MNIKPYSQLLMQGHEGSLEGVWALLTSEPSYRLLLSTSAMNFAAFCETRF